MLSHTDLQTHMREKRIRDIFVRRLRFVAYANGILQACVCSFELSAFLFEACNKKSLKSRGNVLSKFDVMS